MRKLVTALFIGGALVGAALGQTPAPVNPPVVPTPTPAPSPVVPPVPVPVAITGDTSIPCYGFARLALSGTYTSAGWLCFPDRMTGAKVVSTYTTPNGHVFLVSGSPGAYDIGAFAQTPTGIVTMQTVVTIQPATPAPTPGPVPPTPGPAPIPVPPAPTPTPTPKPFPSTQVLPGGGLRRG